MNIDKLLQSFGEAYILIDNNSCVVNGIYPAKEDVFPISYEEFVQTFFTDITQEDKNKLVVC